MHAHERTHTHTQCWAILSLQSIVSILLGMDMHWEDYALGRLWMHLLCILFYKHIRYVHRLIVNILQNKMAASNLGRSSFVRL